MASVSTNPVLTSAAFAFKHTNLVTLNEKGIQTAATFIYRRIISESYKPQTWRDQPLHLVPPCPFDPNHPKTRLVLDYIFLISALNFSFWSDKEESPQRFAIEWRRSWSEPPETPTRLWTGYWSLLAAINKGKAIDKGIPITDPSFYSSEVRCPDSLIMDMFRPAPGSAENFPLLKERIKILRENHAGSFYNLLTETRKEFGNRGLALHVVRKVVNEFPSFRDETFVGKRQVCFWKRAQILVAETWAAFHPENDGQQHPLFPEGVSELTMFADYRVPQILNRLQVIEYPDSLIRKLKRKETIISGSQEEVSIRSASILAVEEIRKVIQRLIDNCHQRHEINSVLIDFWLWDTSKKLESRELDPEFCFSDELPTHRTRCIWY